MELMPRKPKDLDELRARALKGTVRRGDVIPETGQTIIGTGAECLVLSHPDSSDKVIAYSFRREKDAQSEILRAKYIFYLSRFFSTLFPHNFPRFHAVYAPQNANDNLVSIRRKIHETDNGAEEFEADKGFFTGLKKILLAAAITTRLKRPVIKYPFDDVLETLPRMGIYQYFIFDTSTCNFVIGDDGGEYYVDTIQKFWAENYNEQKISDFMRKHKYSNYNIQIALSSIARLKELKREFEDKVGEKNREG